MNPTTVDISLRPKQAADFYKIGTSTLWCWVKTKPGFPQPVRLGERVTIFRLSELIAYRDARAQKAAA